MSNDAATDAAYAKLLEEICVIVSIAEAEKARHEVNLRK